MSTMVGRYHELELPKDLDILSNQRFLQALKTSKYLPLYSFSDFIRFFGLSDTPAWCELPPPSVPGNSPLFGRSPLITPLK